VSNGSFEDHADCPEFLAQIELCQEWWGGGGTPDYYNSCAEGGFMSVPSNVLGFQPSFDGVAYSGILAFHQNAPEYREFLMTSLVSPLVVGQQYFASFRVSPSYTIGYRGFCNGLGIRLEMDSASFAEPISVGSPMIYSAQIVSDTSIWTVVSGSFIADQPYRYLSLGNFYTAMRPL